jgi:SAM-dependent methyltransferase
VNYVERNRTAWTTFAPQYAKVAPRIWSRTEIDWGVWNVPESDVGALGEVAGLDVVDLGCGTGYFSAWLARRDARPVGIDVTPAQLATARAMQRQFGLAFPLVEGNAERLPFRDGSFDLALSEYGASIWCDPHLWIPEAARVLRPNGRLVFLCNSVLSILTAGELGGTGTELLRDYFGMHRVEWPDTGEVEFRLGYGDWIRLLRSNGFEVDDLIELQAPPNATKHPFSDVDPEWAQRWPSEEIWVAHKER